jgi:hypothetical protein
MPAPKKSPVVSLRALCKALSIERLGAYSSEADRDSTDAIARYIWNGALCAAVQPSLHALEVTLRNTLFNESVRMVNTAGRAAGSVSCWLDLKPSLLMPYEEQEVVKAKDRLGLDPKFHTPGRLIAKLGFGFWVALCRRPYDHGRKTGPQLWPHLVPRVFPYAPKPLRNRQAISDKLESIREFRNRIAHHEPIWDKKLLVQHSEILEVLGWMNPPMKAAAQACSDVVYMHHVGPAQFRVLAATLLGTEV